MRPVLDPFETPTWRHRVVELAAQHRVPGAQVGVLALDADGLPRTTTTAAGVTSLITQVEVDDQTIFQWGSITKVATTTLIMQLIDEGRLHLDDQVADLLPGFALADSDAADAITVRQLLTHTSGIDGDLFIDTGDGDDCVQRYVEQLRTATSTTPPGGHLSYCNAGFVVAGRIVEVLRGAGWDDVLTRHLLRPLELEHTVTRAKDVPRFRAAVGHLRSAPGSEEYVPTPTWMLPRSMGPAGLITGSVTDLLGFAALHLRDGATPDGTELLSPAAARQMRELHVDLRAQSSIQAGWGLGWSLTLWGDQVAVTHGGATIGQIADLTVLPDHGLALGVLTNARSGSPFIRDIHQSFADELGFTAPAPNRTPDPTAGVDDLLGRWESSLLRWTISRDDDRLIVTTTTKQPVTGEPDPPPQTATVTGPGRFLINTDGTELEVQHVRADGRDQLWFGRLLQRVTD